MPWMFLLLLLGKTLFMVVNLLLAPLVVSLLLPMPMFHLQESLLGSIARFTLSIVNFIVTSTDVAVENEEALLEGPDGDVAGEIDLEPNDTSLLDPDDDVPDPPVADVEPMVVDHADKTLVAPSDADSAVGSDARTGSDTSFQSGTSGASLNDSNGGSDPGAASTADDSTSGDSSLVTSSSAMDVHECVSLISDAVHVQAASTTGVVDARLVSSPEILRLIFLISSLYWF